ncbi:MAG TPA: hypothetical protein VFS00_32030 [Polyangiaceae bacterium]|nr:hypothetical protein [Polyangiaceae bacterium]
MAPAPPLGRDYAMKLVAEGKLPVSFGSPHVCVMALEQDGVFRLRQLVVDEREAAAALEEARAQRLPFQPEHYYGLGRPTGTIYAEAPSREGLLEQMRTIPWPKNW